MKITDYPSADDFVAELARIGACRPEEALARVREFSATFPGLTEPSLVQGMAAHRPALEEPNQEMTGSY